MRSPPNDGDLREFRKGWYPSPTELVGHVRESRHHGARLLVGYVPFVLADALPRRPLTVMLLREPVARAVSMMDHRRTSSKRYRDATYQELLVADDGFVSRQLRDYQAKMLAFDSLDECAESVNVPLDIDETRFGRALERLAKVDVLGVVEDLPGFTRRLERVTGIRPGPERSANRSRGERAPLDATVRRRLAELTARDQVLYVRARELIADEGRGRVSIRRLHERWGTRR